MYSAMMVLLSMMDDSYCWALIHDQLVRNYPPAMVRRLDPAIMVLLSMIDDSYCGALIHDQLLHRGILST